MPRALILLSAAAAVLVGTAGCSMLHPCRCSTGVCSFDDAETPLPPAERTGLEADLFALAATVLPPEAPRLPAAYRALNPLQAQCLAARHAPTADAFDRQRQNLQNQQNKSSCLCGRGADKQRAFQAMLLAYSALEIRDQFAGGAMEWYYQLAGAEAKEDLLALSLNLGRDTLTRIERLKKQGIPLPAPVEEYQRQLADLQLQQAQNQLTIEQLNAKLRAALGYDPGDAWRFWPDPGVPVGTETVPDVEAAVALGLAQRPHLILLREAIAHLDKDTLGSSRELLRTISPLLGMSDPKTGCKVLLFLAKLLHIQPGVASEVESVRAQLCNYLKEREMAVAAEVRQAVDEVRARREFTILARQAAETWQARIRDLEKQRKQGINVFADWTKAHLEWYKARGDVAREFLGWKIAAIKVKQAQGVLPAECGYTGCGNGH